MILRHEEECQVEGKAQRGGDDWGVEADGSGEDGGGCGARAGGVEAHHLRVGGEVWRLDVNEAQRLRQLEDEKHRLKKLVADLSPYK